MQTLIISLDRADDREAQGKTVERIKELGFAVVGSKYYSGMDSPTIYFVGNISDDDVKSIEDAGGTDSVKVDPDSRAAQKTMAYEQLATPEQKAEIDRLVELAHAT